MRNIVLSDLRLRCQQRLDKEGDPQIGDAANGGKDPLEWNRLISEMYGELYSIVEKAGMRYFESAQAITGTGIASYALPADHLATVVIERYETPSQTATSRVMRLRRISVQERPRWVGQTAGTPRRFELSGQNIVFFPPAATGTAFNHIYMPQAPDLTNAIDSTPIDVVTADGEALMIWGVAIKGPGAKSEADVQLAIGEREAARGRFETWCALRAFTDSPRVVVDHGPDDEDFLYPSEGSFWLNRT